jgi:hypothetical protein
MTKACDAPVVLPETSLTQADVESFWLRDRVALMTCGERLSALTDWYQQRDAALGGP